MNAGNPRSASAAAIKRAKSEGCTSWLPVLEFSDSPSMSKAYHGSGDTLAPKVLPLRLGRWRSTVLSARARLGHGAV
jgi:hypothetical protein